MTNFLIIFTTIFFSFSLHAKTSTVETCDPEIKKELKYSPTPVYAPATPKLPFKCDGNVKVFEITAEVVMSVFDEKYEPGPVYTWGYNGSNPGPVMEIIEGETVRVHFKNDLPESTTLHWHGLEVPYGQDGAPGHSQNPVMPGMSHTYEWKAEQAGTFMYHSSQNLAKQLSMGLVGFLIIHPKKTPETLVDHDILLFLQMWALPAHSIFPDPMAMMFNYFTMNGKASPYIPSPTIYVGQKARIRFANMSMVEHPVHLHGHTWRVVATGAGDNPRTSHTLGNTILIPTAQTMDVIIDEVKTPGEWMFHCHLPHHVTNNMDIEPIPGEPMDMDNGGMHLVMNVHKAPGEPGYSNPTPPPGGGHGGGHGDHGAMAPKFTTYDGYIKLPNGKRMDASLEFYKVQEGTDWRKVKAFLKVFLSKDEFISYHYEKLNFNYETGLFNLEAKEKSITLSNLSYMDHGDMGMISGEASIDFGATTGELKLNSRDKARQDIKLKSNFSISGEYTSSCNGSENYLQVITARGFRSGEIDSNNPIANFLSTGTLGLKDGATKRVESSIEEVAYNPFNSIVNFKVNTNGAISILNCMSIFTGNKVTGLNCDNSCSYSKVENNERAESSLNKPRTFISSSSNLLSELNTHKDFPGMYKGLLNLKNNKSVGISLNLNAKRFANNMMALPKNYLAGTLSLHLADKELSYKVVERPFLDSSSIINGGKNVLMLETHDKIELVISKWTAEQIDGAAYHADYGHLGNFAVLKSAKDFSGVIRPEDRENISLIPALDGVFKNDKWELKLVTTLIEEPSTNSVFSPLHLKGSLRSLDGFLTINFIDGTYDFALGVFYLRTDDNRLVKATIDETNSIEMILPSKPVRRTRYLDLTLSKFVLKKEL